jgi:hypothetical protein
LRLVVRRVSFSRAIALVSLSLCCGAYAGVTPAWAQAPNQTPTIVVTSPTDDSLGEPDLRVKASCVDDAPGCSLTLRINHGPVLADSTDGTIDTVIRPPDGEQVLHFYALDAGGLWITKTIPVFVHSAPQLRGVNYYDGVFLDIDDGHLLTWSGPSLWTPPGGTALRSAAIYDRMSRVSTTVWTASHPGQYPVRGVLTPAGALLVIAENGSQPRLHEARGGVLTDLGPIVNGVVVVNGPWAVFAGNGPGPLPLTLRNLITGVNTLVTNDADWNGYDVTADGRVIFSTFTAPRQVMEYTPGSPSVITPLTASAPLWSTDPVTDGSRVVFIRQIDDYSPPSIMLRNADGSETTLATFSKQENVWPREQYHVAGGWVAFVRPTSNSGTMQLWLRAPDGTERQLSFGSWSRPRIEALSETGEIVFSLADYTLGNTTTVRRSFAFPDGRTLDLGTTFGTPLQTDGGWYVIAGKHLLQIGGNPQRAILAEGATGAFFTTDVAIFNPHGTPVPATIRYLPELGPSITETRELPAMSRTTIQVDSIPDLENASVSTIVTSPSTSPLVVERLMSWGSGAGYGGHLATAVDRPRIRWLFAEGSQGFFYTYFLLANNDAMEATVTFTFLVEQGTPVTHVMKVPPFTRRTVYAGDVPGLIDRSFATIIDSTLPIVAERAMYFGDNPLWYGGHGTMGVPEASHTWTHAEGATGSFFDTFLLLANPDEVNVKVRLTYVSFASGQRVVRDKTIPALGRLTINVEEDAPQIGGGGVAVRVESLGAPIVSERAVYWGGAEGWREAHDSFGAPEPGTKWGLAEGRRLMVPGYQTFILIANHGDKAAEVRLTFVREDGQKIERTLTVEAESRANVDCNAVPELGSARFSTLIESLNDQPINVESAIYWNHNIVWDGGGNTLATRLR